MKNVLFSLSFILTSIVRYSVFLNPVVQIALIFATVQLHSATGNVQIVDASEEDEFLAEIMAEEQREAEEMQVLEEEMKMLEELRAQHEKMQQSPSSKSKMRPGNPSGTPGGKIGSIEEEIKRKEAEKAEQERNANKLLQEEAEKKKADEIARKREEAYQAELERIEDEKIRKSLQRQKKKDGQVVKKILRNSQNEKHYAVLGLRCKWGEIELPFGFKICSLAPGDIKKAYRNIAKSVHPDKNRDGRANEAFDAIERSASILLDKEKKRSYDLKLARQRKAALDKGFITLKATFISIKQTIRLLGPFATPVIILLALII